MDSMLQFKANYKFKGNNLSIVDAANLYRWKGSFKSRYSLICPVCYGQPAVVAQATWLQRTFCIMTDTLEATLRQDTPWYLQIFFANSKAVR